VLGAGHRPPPPAGIIDTIAAGEPRPADVWFWEPTDDGPLLIPVSFPPTGGRAPAWHLARLVCQGPPWDRNWGLAARALGSDGPAPVKVASRGAWLIVEVAPAFRDGLRARGRWEAFVQSLARTFAASPGDWDRLTVTAAGAPAEHVAPLPRAPDGSRRYLAVWRAGRAYAALPPGQPELLRPPRAAAWTVSAEALLPGKYLPRDGAVLLCEIRGDTLSVALSPAAMAALTSGWGEPRLLADLLWLNFAAPDGPRRVDIHCGGAVLASSSPDPACRLCLNRTLPPTCSLGESGLKLVCGGDLMIGRAVNTWRRTRGGFYPLARIASRLGGADIALANLEAVLTTAEDRLPGKGIWLRADPEVAGLLADVGFDALSCANNHTIDFDSTGIRDTITALTGAGLPWAGAGLDLLDAHLPVRLETAGHSVVLLAYTDWADLFWSHAYPRSSRATPDRPGVAALEAEAVLGDLRAVAGTADIIVVSCHWGTEDSHVVTPEQRRLARRMIVAGADVVLGHHPHVLQGVERFGTGVVLYSLGNLCCDQRDRDNRRSVLAEIAWRAGRAPEVLLHPLRIDEGAPRPSRPEELAVDLAGIRSYCRALGTEARPTPDGRAVEVLWPEGLSGG